MSGVPIDTVMDQVQQTRQRVLTQSTQLPVLGTPGHYRNKTEEEASEAAWAASGIIFHGATDDLFRTVELPNGWKMQPSDHLMWSHLLDQKGRVRARIFYKTEIFRSEAFITLETRFSIERLYSRDPHVNQVQHAVMDGTRQRFETNRVVLGTKPRNESALNDWYRRDEQLTQKQRIECEAWLEERYPKWREYGAHWDDE
jgi:hypothetical protein